MLKISALVRSPIQQFKPAGANQAEILQTLEVVTNHYHSRSYLGLNKLFRWMVSDSEVAKNPCH